MPEGTHFIKRQITGVYAMISTIYWHDILSFNITRMYAMFDHMYTFLLSLLFITGMYEFSKNFKFFVMFFDDFDRKIVIHIIIITELIY